MAAAEWRATRLVPRRAAISRAQVETVSGRALGVFGLVFGGQTVPIAIGQAPALADGAGIALMAVLYGSLAALAVATFARVAVRAAAATFAVLFAIALVAWPYLVGSPAGIDGAPWLYYLVTVATTAAVIAVPPMPAAVYTVLIPIAYGVIRATPAGGGANGFLAALDAMYSMILGIVALVIITMLRQAAEAVDAAQDAALQRYDVVARQHANEIERVKVDALVHDSVLTTLLSAAAARTPAERALAARMAGDAVRRLDEAAAELPGNEDRVGLDVLVRRLRTAVAGFSAPIDVRPTGLGGVELPVEAVDALSSAAVQAMVNSVQHADESGRAVGRTVEVRGAGANGCVIRVADDGSGFDPAAVPMSRIGLRVSIEERMANAGGTATVESAPGEGTVVTLAWPAGVEASDS
ncbi:sensor histidine kinase [Agromyces sp. C10]|uniref:sensor histidine kinase n=1 Tax=Agromyces sp. C10 TaxID=2935077 RepID=UPI00200A4687|nr:ATP-binding protein [Agromyces sp. C10]MCK8608636.1 ATP-binding protein [Agromyces sp. C10]